MRGLVVLSVAFLCLAFAGAASAADALAITHPSEDVTLAFVQPGRIAKLCCKEGDEVKAGQVVAQQDDEAEKVEVAQLKAAADDTVHIKAAIAQRDEKIVERDKLQAAYEKKAVPKFDLDKAVLDVTIAELSLDLANFQHEQDRMKYEDKRIQVERMRLLCPIDGKVEKISQRAGEAAKVNEEVMRVVKIDPLWVDAVVRLQDARTLKAGDLAEVVTSDGSATALGKGKVIWISGVADSASNTLKVRLELPNAAGRPAGESVTVRFHNP